MKRMRPILLAFGFAGLLGAQIPDFTPPTPLLGALLHDDTAEAKRLLDSGANPNEARFIGFPPVFLPVIHGNLELLKAMVEKGADVKALDPSGSTTLMWATLNEAGDPALVEELLRTGLDPNAKNKSGETALTWSSRRGQTPITAALRRAGASDADSIRDSAQRGLAILEKTSPQFIKVSGCVSCHNQFLPQIAASVARQHGLTVNDKVTSLETQWALAVFKPMREQFAHSPDRLPDAAISASYALLGLAADNYPADENTAALANLIVAQQNQDGSFRTLPMRPPIEMSHFAATALSLRALQLYGTDIDERVERAAHWLAAKPPNTNEDRAMQLLGLGWAHVQGDAVSRQARELIAQQRPDGGWAQLPGLETDAYATGQALVALQWGAHVPVSDPAYQRGISFLLRTQFADGSWLVRSRAFPFQPYKESGFPFGKDQWISAAGTSWATMALSLALPAPNVETK